MSPTRTMANTAVVIPEGGTGGHVGAVEAFLHRPHADQQTAKLVASNGEEVQVPAQLVEALKDITKILAQGHGVAINSVASELTTTEAATMLGVSRPTLIKLLDTDQLPARRVGTHRRVMLHDLLDYRRQQLKARRKAYEDLMREADALGLHDED